MLPNPDHIKYIVPQSEITYRIKKLQQEMLKQEIGLTWIQHPADLYYFSGTIQDGVLLIPAGSDPLFFVKMSIKRAETESPLPVEPFPGRKGLIKKARELAGSGTAVGVSLDVTPSTVYALIIKLWPEIKIKDISYTLKLIKSVKSDWEIDQIKGAGRQAETLIPELPDLIHIGMTELEAAAILEKRLRDLGHPGIMRIRSAPETHSALQFSTGDSANYPTNFNGPLGSSGLYPATGNGPSQRLIEPGRTVMLDFVTAYNGYHTDFTRTFFTSNEIPENVLEVHQFCLDVLERLEAELKPGNNCQDIYNETLAWAQERGMPEGFMGYAENKVRFFGHGIGTELDEMPVIANRVDLNLEMNMVLAVEPKAFITGIGGVGVEDTYVIKKDGPQPFLNLNRDIVKLS